MFSSALHQLRKTIATTSCPLSGLKQLKGDAPALSTNHDLPSSESPTSMPRTIEIATRTLDERNLRRYSVNPVYLGDNEPKEGSKNDAVFKTYVLARAWDREIDPKRIIGSSVITAPSRPERFLGTSKNGFLDAVINAYSHHHHLTISPDDVWVAILAQFNIYVNAHGEELRSHFVAHQGQKNLHVGTELYDKDPRTTQYFAAEMVKLMQENVVDPDLAEWILPNFTTPTPNDIVACTIMMMSTLKTFFTYSGGIECGIPSITLEGEKSDWESILARLDKLPTFGPEPTAWAALLRPVLSHFVKAFELEEGSDSDLFFWERICDYDDGSGFANLSGWITAFAVWDEKAKWRGDDPHRIIPEMPGVTRWQSRLVLDGVAYPNRVSVKFLPKGYGEAEISMRSGPSPVKVVAGHLGWEAWGERMDNIRPYSAWLILDATPPKPQTVSERRR